MRDGEHLKAKIVVTDTGPLITLAAADRLDYLLIAEIPIFLPDAVLHEATKDIESLGASSILEWRDRHANEVQTVTTEAFLRYVQALETAPGRRERDLGERAAIEAIHDAIPLATSEYAILLTEDDKVLRQVLVLQPELSDRIIPVTTRDFLTELEAAGRINSADEVYRAAAAAGRNASPREILKHQASPRRESVRETLRRKDP